MKIKKVHIVNYKSIKDQIIDFNKINIMIGGNGVGKTNLISYFKLLNQIINKNLQIYIRKGAGADNYLYFGRKTSAFIQSRIEFITSSGGLNAYSFRLEADNNNSLFFAVEKAKFMTGNGQWYDENLGSGHIETNLNETNYQTRVVKYVKNVLMDFRVYHFHDTSENASVKQNCQINDSLFLREDASNLAAFLFKLRKNHNNQYNLIEATITQIAPFFDKFILSPIADNESMVTLDWKEKGSDKYFNAHNLSDGTIRMICLVTLLLQPNPPSTIIIDEPELGLHPAAINLLAELIKSSSLNTQIIISTQSVTLLNQFTPSDVIIVDRYKGDTIFKRINDVELSHWLDDYSLGEAWEKNIFGGRP